MITCKALLIAMLMICTFGGSSQLISQELMASTRPPSENVSQLALVDISAADEQGILDIDFFMNTIGDSVWAIKWKDWYWFGFKRRDKDWEGNGPVELFAWKDSTLHQITYHNVYFERYRSDLRFFGNRLFHLSNSNNGDPIGHIRILVIDENMFGVEKELSFRNGAWLKAEYAKDNKLYIEVRPMERRLNLLHYLFPWSREPKWLFNEKGNSWKYILDSEFNITKEEEIER